MPGGHRKQLESCRVLLPLSGCPESGPGRGSFRLTVQPVSRKLAPPQGLAGKWTMGLFLFPPSLWPGLSD